MAKVRMLLMVCCVGFSACTHTQPLKSSAVPVEAVVQKDMPKGCRLEAN